MKPAPKSAVKTRTQKLDELLVKATKLAKSKGLNLVAIWQADEKNTVHGHFVKCDDGFAFDTIRAVIKANPNVLNMGAKGTEAIKALTEGQVITLDDLKATGAKLEVVGDDQPTRA